jgi:cephalosporin-C deacetylase
VTDVSQGGGLALIVGSLDPRVRAVAAQVPYLCGIVRSAALVDTEPLAELRRWLSASVTTERDTPRPR